MKLWSSCLVVGLVFLLMGCGSRKTETQLSVEKKSLDLKELGSYDITAETRKNTTVSSAEYEWTAEPVNPDKEMEFTAPDGKTYKGKNTRLTGKKKKEASNVVEESSVKKSGHYESEIKASQYKKDKTKKTDRKADWSFLWVLFAVLVFIVVRKVYKSMKSGVS